VSNGVKRIFLAICFSIVLSSVLGDPFLTSRGGLSSGNVSSATVKMTGSIGARVYLGAWLDGDMPDIYNEWVNETGKGLAVYATFAALMPGVPVPNNGSIFEPTLTTRLRDALPWVEQGFYGAVCLTWMTAYSTANIDTGPNGTAFQCTSEVATGQWDSVIRDSAMWVKNNFPYKLIIRIDQEFNSPVCWGWGKDPIVYVAAYKRIVDIFRQENVPNVEWCWSPNFESCPWVRFSDYYPGDDYVDWVGTSLYANTWGWKSFDDMLNATDSLNPVCPYDFSLAYNKPFMIAEWGLNITDDMSDAQSAVWMEGLFSAIETRPSIRMMVHWAAYEWCVLNYPQALQVYRINVAIPKYSSQYP
jgi:hypothetical protein